MKMEHSMRITTARNARFFLGSALAIVLVSCARPEPSQDLTREVSAEGQYSLAAYDTRMPSGDDVTSAWLALCGTDDSVRSTGVAVLASFDPQHFRRTGYSSEDFSPVVAMELRGAKIVLGAPGDPTGMRALLASVPRLAPLARASGHGSESHVLLAADELLAGVMESAHGVKDPTVYGYAVMGRRLIFDEMLRLDPPPISEEEIGRRRDLYTALSRDPRLRPSNIP